MRPAPEFIEILLPVWGERYTRDFLDLCMPSLLAPGNLPALARHGRCTFVLLAPERDVDVIQMSSLWPRLLDCCSVRVMHIDDLASSSSSTVLTLAYVLAIRTAGKRALDTCFVPLVADYVMADGSLLAAVKRIYAGASGVLAGNFQIEGELAYSRLQERKSAAGVLAIAPRSLVEMSLNALHPATVSEIVDDDNGLKPNANRFFWRVNENCMVGRFFLMHMIAIHPERTDFVIAAPSDYSLIPEMCPSGQVVRMTDSDEYFVVECQPRGEVPESTPHGRVEPRTVARALAMWATATHRDNARHAIVFHAESSPQGLAEAIAASGAFVGAVEAHSVAPPKPFRHHPGWSRSLDYHIATAQREQELARLAWITGDESLTKGGAVGRLRASLLGRAPDYRPWHPRWPDVRMLRLKLAAARGDVAFVSNASARVRTWLGRVALEQGARSVVHFRTADVQKLPDTRDERSEARFDSLFLIADGLSEDVTQALPRLALRMKPGGIVVLVAGQIFAETELQPVLVPDEGTFGDSGFSLEHTTCVGQGTWRVSIQTTMMRCARKATREPGLRTPFWLAIAGGLAAISMFINVAGHSGRKARKELRLSSLFLTLRRSELQLLRTASLPPEENR